MARKSNKGKNVPMYRYCYHKAAIQFVRLLEEFMWRSTNETFSDIHFRRHLLAAMILNLEARGYIFPKSFKDEMVGADYDWSDNIC